MTDSQWDGLMMPINMAFFFRSTPQNRVIALYPSPAGATESLLSFDTWDEIEARKSGAAGNGSGRRSAAGQPHRPFPRICSPRILSGADR